MCRTAAQVVVRFHFKSRGEMIQSREEVLQYIVSAQYRNLPNFMGISRNQRTEQAIIRPLSQPMPIQTYF